MRITKVLVPIDFSPPSRLAFNHGIAFARKFKASLLLLHVVDEANALTFTEMAALEKEHQEQARRMLSALVPQENQDQLDLSVMVKSGAVEGEILSTIREENVDLVVMGTHGRGLVGRWLIGSATQGVLRNVEIPMLTVCHVTHRPTLDRILFATDLSDTLNKSAHIALDVAEATKASLIAMHSVEVGVDGGAEAAVYLTDERLAEARAKMDGLKEEAIRRDVEIEFVLKEGVAAGAILDVAEQQAADLIMITLQRSGSTEPNEVGSTAQHVIRESHVPVLSVPVAAKANAAQGTAETYAA